VETDGERIFTIFQKYDSKDGLEPVFEEHRKFIDVQYLHSGCELIFVLDSPKLDGDYRGYRCWWSFGSYSWERKKVFWQTYHQNYRILGESL